MPRKTADAFHIVLGDEGKAAQIREEMCRRYGICEFDRKIFLADIAPVETVLDEVCFQPLFSERKLIHYRGVENLRKSDWERLVSYLEKPYPHICLILEGTRARGVRLERFSPIVGKAPSAEESGLFSMARRSRDAAAGELVLAFHSYLDGREQNFPVVIAAVETYLRDVLQRKGRITPDIRGKFSRLHDLDYSLKTGRISPETGIELFVYYLLD